MGASSRRKGSLFETAVIAWLRERGRPHVERRIAGMANDRGDITGWPGVIVECKNAKRHDLAGWLAQLEDEIELAAADTGVVVVKRHGARDPGKAYAVMPFWRWEALMREAMR